MFAQDRLRMELDPPQRPGFVTDRHRSEPCESKRFFAALHGSGCINSERMIADRVERLRNSRKSRRHRARSGDLAMGRFHTRNGCRRNRERSPDTPRQTPRTGTVARRITSAETPKSREFAGWPGPGETMIASRSRALENPVVVADHGRHFAGDRSSQVRKVIRERIVVIDDQEPQQDFVGSAVWCCRVPDEYARPWLYGLSRIGMRSPGYGFFAGNEATRRLPGGSGFNAMSMRPAWLKPRAVWTAVCPSALTGIVWPKCSGIAAEILLKSARVKVPLPS